MLLPGMFARARLEQELGSTDFDKEFNPWAVYITGEYTVDCNWTASAGFGYAFYLPNGALPLFITCPFFVGVGGGSFAVYWVWLAEQYRTECRGSALAFASCIGRFVAAGATFLVGMGIQHYGSMGVPVALTAIPFAIGLFLLPLGIETKGKPLPL